jgi:hypothetical protein
MKRLLLVSFLSACTSGAEPGPLVCDYSEQGLCVATNGFAVERERIVDALEMLGNSIRISYDKELNLTEFLTDYTPSVEYVGGLSKRGLTIDRAMRVRFSGEPTVETTFTQCLDRYYVLQHELLHVLAHYAWGVSREANHTHEVPGLFSIGTHDGSISVEDYAVFGMASRCKQ